MPSSKCIDLQSCTSCTATTPTLSQTMHGEVRSQIYTSCGRAWQILRPPNHGPTIGRNSVGTQHRHERVARVAYAAASRR
ncbi:hypothetical protein CERZMDRAFT_91996 [Cercospora zeae-maydis SCOH1-5]|uniref:Uncharacterized protein n=1 Tax=Cercospora zeae-maydis SCOH1-5 TaxID=717836 RepID=A0A6A6EYQ4_9PEZI|nr:hypothetical protein CERZMDRAFT_91996 [Cercospora zeae-maydis SCOH1-5]